MMRTRKAKHNYFSLFFFNSRPFEASCRADKEDQKRADAVKCRGKGGRHELCRIRSAPAKRRTKGILVCNNIRQLPDHFQI